MNTLTDAQPILTRRTAELMKDVLRSDDATALNTLLDDVLERGFGPFLRGAGADTESDFYLAAARYHNSRLKLAALLLGAVSGDKLGDMLRSLADLSLQIIEQNAWKLSTGDRQALQCAFRSYEAMLTDLERMAVPEAARVPFNLVMRATRMDFCLSAAIAYLEGGIPGEVNPERVRYICRQATVFTDEVHAAVHTVRLAENPKELARWRAERLAGLRGIWGDDPAMDAELKLLYEARLNTHDGD